MSSESIEKMARFTGHTPDRVQAVMEEELKTEHVQKLAKRLGKNPKSVALDCATSKLLLERA